VKILAKPTKYVGTNGLATRAHKRQQFAQILRTIAGVDTNNRDGRNGEEGRSGHDGRDGSRGENGTNGSSGGNGENGRHGKHSDDVRIAIRGSPNQLYVSGIDNSPREAFINCGESDFIFIDTKGGNGGDGGNGGRGGRGGDGGRGRDGRDGQPGRNATNPGQAGGNGSNGTDGERGGDGGHGGSGGNAGDGGDAGNGGNVHIAVDRRETALLWLFEYDARRGEPGRGGSGGQGGAGGKGGEGGRGGDGGRGGSGGPAQNGRPGGPRGQDGRRGRDGPRGADGRAGPSGRSGRDGQEGRNGNTYIHIYDNGRHIKTVSDRFEAGTVTYEIHDDNDDGIFEPASEFIVDNFEFTNTGELEMPPGAIATIRADEPTVSAGITHVCPEVQPGARYRVPTQFRARIADVQPTKDCNYQAFTALTSEVSLLKRPFPESLVKTPSLPIQWPVRVVDVRVIDWLGPGESAQLQVILENISRRPYGGPKSEVVAECKTPGSAGDASAGTVEIRLTVDPLLEIIAPAVPGNNYVIQDGGTGAVFAVPKFNGKTTTTVEFTVRMKTDAGSKLFMQLPWRVDLLLRDRCICYYSRSIRVTPKFQPNILSDLLLITCEKIDRNEFLAWSYLCQMLGCSVNFWDLQRYNGLAAQDVDWTRSARVFIFPCFPDQGTVHEATKGFALRHLRFADFAKHMSSAPDDQGALFLGITPDCFGPGLTCINSLIYDYADAVRGRLGTGPTVNGRGGSKEFINMRPGQMNTNAPAPAETNGRGVTNFPPINNYINDVFPDDKSENIELCYAGACICCTFLPLDQCTHDPLVRMNRYRKHFENADRSRRYLVQYDGKFSSGFCCPFTPNMSVFPCVYRRGTPIATLAEPTLISGWLPYNFDGTYFQAKEEVWQDGPFLQTFLTLMHLLPVEQRLALNTLPHVAKLQFNLKGVGVVPFSVCSVASLARSIATEISAGDKRVPTAARMLDSIQTNPPLYGPLAHLMIGALSAPTLEDEVLVCGKNAQVSAAYDASKAIRSKIHGFAQQGHQLGKASADAYADAALNVGQTKLRGRDEKTATFLRYLTQKMYMPCEDESFDYGIDTTNGKNLKAIIQPYNVQLRDWQAQSWSSFEFEDQQRIARAQAEAAAAAAKAAREYWERMAAPPPPPTHYQIVETVLPAPPSYHDAAMMQQYEQSWQNYHAQAAQYAQVDYYGAAITAHASAPIQLDALNDLASQPPPAFTNMDVGPGATVVQ